MKLSRYTVSGRTQKNGMGAMLCVNSVVTASSNPAGQAANATQIKKFHQRGYSASTDKPAPGYGIAGIAHFAVRNAQPAHNAANNTYAPDQTIACTRVGVVGSIANG